MIPDEWRAWGARRLGRAEEIDLGRRAEAGDRAAEEELVRHNLPLVAKLAAGYSRLYGTDPLDAFGRGQIGLLSAVRQYRADTGCRFSTYAAYWIRQAIRRGLHGDAHPIHVPEYVLLAAARQARGRGPGRAAPRVADYRAIGPVARLDAEGGTIPVPAPAADAPDHSAAIGRALAGLEPREAHVIRRRFGIGCGPELLKDIGAGLGLSSERVRQIESKALGKLKSLLDDLDPREDRR